MGVFFNNLIVQKISDFQCQLKNISDTHLYHFHNARYQCSGFWWYLKDMSGTHTSKIWGVCIPPRHEGNAICIPPRYKGVPWAVDWLVCLAPSHLHPRWIVKSRKSQFDFHELFRSRSFIINFSLLGHLCILGDNVFCSWCRVGSPQPVMCFTLNDHVVAMLTIRDVFDNEFFWKDWLPASHVILGHLTFYLFL